MNYVFNIVQINRIKYLSRFKYAKLTTFCYPYSNPPKPRTLKNDRLKEPRHIRR